MTSLVIGGIGTIGAQMTGPLAKKRVELIENQAPSTQMSNDVYVGLDQLPRKLKVERRPRAVPPVPRPPAEPPAGAETTEADRDAGPSEPGEAEPRQRGRRSRRFHRSRSGWGTGRAVADVRSGQARHLERPRHDVLALGAGALGWPTIR